ncbi:MAG: phosphatase PAP2 family protein [Verrucomicrobiota bacterium]|nr:phosphatase PAP2 family protein [Verrucomicrobiota bacterium]
MKTPSVDRTTRRFARQRRFLQARLSPEGYLGLHLTIGVLMILAAGWWFGDIAEDMSRNAGTRIFDEDVAMSFHQQATPLTTQAARIGSFFGSVGFIGGASCCTALVLLWRKSFYPLLAFALAMGGGSALNILLKHFFHRQRPVLENPFVTLTSYGFPSGHTMGSTLFYGMLALIAAQSIRRWPKRALPFCIAGLIVATIGFTRIYLGAHYLTDVLGAVAAGLAWLTLCWTGVETLRRWRETRSTARHR